MLLSFVEASSSLIWLAASKAAWGGRLPPGDFAYRIVLLYARFVVAGVLS